LTASCWHYTFLLKEGFSPNIAGRKAYLALLEEARWTYVKESHYYGRARGGFDREPSLTFPGEGADMCKIKEFSGG
jgi:hypothetical protein